MTNIKDPTYKLKVNNSYDIEVSITDLNDLDILKISDTKYHILIKEKSVEAEITEADFHNKSYKVKLNNNVYNILINNELDQLIDEMGFSVGSSKHIDTIKAPMPGLILDINVILGQEVQEDDPLLILEAMKMENVISSPRQGIIKSISAMKGDAVEKNQLLIEFE